MTAAGGTRRVGAIILAAGHSSRMHSGFKLWRLISGKPMMVHTVDHVMSAGIRPVVVIVKPRDASKVKSFAGDDVEIVINAEYESGMHSSIQAGVLHLQKHYPDLAGFMVCLADQPLLTVRDYSHLSRVFRDHDGRRIVCPTFAGARGNPVLIPMSLSAEVLAHDGGDRGCFYLLRDHPELVELVDMPTDSVLFDVDTEEDFAALTERLLYELRDDGDGPRDL